MEDLFSPRYFYCIGKNIIKSLDPADMVRLYDALRSYGYHSFLYDRLISLSRDEWDEISQYWMVFEVSSLFFKEFKSYINWELLLNELNQVCDLDFIFEFINEVGLTMKRKRNIIGSAFVVSDSGGRYCK